MQNAERGRQRMSVACRCVITNIQGMRDKNEENEQRTFTERETQRPLKVLQNNPKLLIIKKL